MEDEYTINRLANLSDQVTRREEEIEELKATIDDLKFETSQLRQQLRSVGLEPNV